MKIGAAVVFLHRAIERQVIAFAVIGGKVDDQAKPVLKTPRRAGVAVDAINGSAHTAVKRGLTHLIPQACVCRGWPKDLLPAGREWRCGCERRLFGKTQVWVSRGPI